MLINLINIVSSTSKIPKLNQYVSKYFFFEDIPKIPNLPKLSDYNFNSVIDLPKNTPVLDLKNGNDYQKFKEPYSIGKYNEKRYDLYKGDLFEKNSRFIHMGIDIGAPIGTIVKSFFDGEIFHLKIMTSHLIMAIQLLQNICLIMYIFLRSMGI